MASSIDPKLLERVFKILSAITVFQGRAAAALVRRDSAALEFAVNELVTAVGANSRIVKTDYLITHLPEGYSLSHRAFSCLAFQGLYSLKEISEIPDAELLKIKNFGKKSLREVRDLIKALEL